MIFVLKPNKSLHSHINYRPISLLEVPGKILEKIVNRWLIRIIETKGLHNDRQHGFRPSRGTDTALTILHETIATARGSGQTVGLVSRNISRAFHKLWHDGLKYKIRQCDFPDCLTRLLCSYVTDRTARIRIGDFYGPEFTLRSGVPQGGSLSLTLFNLYTHDLDKPTGQADYLAYADDITQIIHRE